MFCILYNVCISILYSVLVLCELLCSVHLYTVFFTLYSVFFLCILYTVLYTVFCILRYVMYRCVLYSTYCTYQIQYLYSVLCILSYSIQVPVLSLFLTAEIAAHY